MNINKTICKSTGAVYAREGETIQSLWSGYGSIVRYSLEYDDPSEAEAGSVIVKHVRPGGAGTHPRGWQTDISHSRKLESYRVESRWYQSWSRLCDDECRIPRCFGLENRNDDMLMVLEDLDAAGFPLRKSSLRERELKACLSWLAHFHARFLGEEPEGLWSSGTYWHLETRPDELSALDDRALAAAAPLIDNKLKSARFQTFIHGDAKIANFCFAPDGKVAAVDFQYVGGGVGMKDLAYFIGSCFYDDECEKRESEILDYYFSCLEIALRRYGRSIDFRALEEEWRMLFPWAWTDFHRFLKGWSPGHWKLNSYSERIAAKVLEKL